MKKLEKLGIAIPNDMSIVGEDNSVLSKLEDVDLTTTSHPQELLGEKAANWVLNTIETGKVQPSELLDTYIIERSSVK